MENIKYGRRREGRWTPIRAKAQDTRANPNSSETHLVRKRWDIGLLRALNPRIMMMTMMMMMMIQTIGISVRVSRTADHAGQIFIPPRRTALPEVTTGRCWQY